MAIGQEYSGIRQPKSVRLKGQSPGRHRQTSASAKSSSPAGTCMSRSLMPEVSKVKYGLEWVGGTTCKSTWSVDDFFFVKHKAIRAEVHLDVFRDCFQVANWCW